MNKFKNSLIGALVLFLGLLSTYGGFRLAYQGLIFPNISIAGVNVTGLNKEAATRIVSVAFETDPTTTTLILNGVEVSKLNELEVRRDIAWAVEQAYGIGRSGNILTQLSEEFSILFQDRKLDVPVTFDDEDLQSTIEQISLQHNREPKWPELRINSDNAVLLPGENGVEIKKDELKEIIVKSLSLPGNTRIEIPTAEVVTSADPALVEKAIDSLNKWGEKKLFLKFRDYETVLDKNKLLNLFGLINDPINNKTFSELVTELAPKIEREPKDAVLVFENNKVNEFKPEVIGAVIDVPALKTRLVEAMYKAEESSIEIPAILTYPKIKAGDINNLGIKELLGQGKSSFSHSIPGRVFNVNLAASRIKGTVVAPGSEFSFNDSVGEISKATGYQSAYVISGGRTVLGDGGGVCQVSTTMFRAALNAGFPITERKAHAYRVGYYEQDSAPGIDATIFSPTADLKFLNDTGHHILIQTSVDIKNMTMSVDIYGTSDGRKASITKPVISSQTPPPATMYVDDPTLPLGTLKQIDWAAWGAKVSFNYKVERGGVAIYEKTFFSNYQPWQAIYMKGTGDLAIR